jgi:hypothetical protein
MEHKAFEFDWSAFDSELHRLLVDALAFNDSASLVEHIAGHIGQLRDPYEGEPLKPDWRSMLGNLDDIHTIGDFALTRYYDPKADFGIGGTWLAINEVLDQPTQSALLGQVVGQVLEPFDPGRMGSYFQSPEMLVQSIAALTSVNRPELHDYISFLGACRALGHGVYVTF